MLDPNLFTPRIRHSRGQWIFAGACIGWAAWKVEGAIIGGLIGAFIGMVVGGIVDGRR